MHQVFGLPRLEDAIASMLSITPAPCVLALEVALACQQSPLPLGLAGVPVDDGEGVAGSWHSSDAQDVLERRMVPDLVQG
eukprot:1973125-Pyramimonas_sp.AAC.1